MIARPLKKLAGIVKATDHAERALATESSDLGTYKHAFETTAADRDRLAADLETYKHAFETTAADRDRIQSEIKRVSEERLRVRAGLLAHALLKELNSPHSSIEAVLARAWLSWAASQGDDPPRDIMRTASDGLIVAAETILRDASLSELALDLVETALEISDAFRGVDHAVDLYYQRRKSLAEHKAYLEAGIAAGAWPDEGTQAAQESAIDRGIPSILLVTLPKSGSIFLWTAIARSLTLPMFRIALSRGPTDEEAVPGLARVFAKGGLCAQQHLTPTKENIDILRSNRVNRILLHIRDPRQAAVSWWHYNLRIGASRVQERSQAEIEEHLWNAYFVHAANWVTKWIEIADNCRDLSIMVSTQEQMAGLEADLVKRMINFYDIPAESYSLENVDRSDAVHFRKGAQDEWLSFFSGEFKKRSEKLVPNRIAERFGWNTI